MWATDRVIHPYSAAEDVSSLHLAASSSPSAILTDESNTYPVSVSSFHGAPNEWNISGSHALKSIRMACGASRSSRTTSRESKISGPVTVSSFHEHPFEWDRPRTEVFFEDLSAYESDSFEYDDDFIPYFDETMHKATTPRKELSSETVFAPNFWKRESQSKATSSLSDILDQMEKKRVSAEPLYGANRVFVTGEEVKNPDDLRRNEQYRTASYHRRYFAKCLDHLKSTCCSELAQLGTDELFSDSVYEKFLYGAQCEFKPNTWIVAWEPKRLEQLTTHTIQSIICAALNSKRKLQWVIGIGSNNEVIGCIISRKQRDKMRQAFDFCTSSGFFPRLPVLLARIRFHVVTGHPDGDDEERFLVEIGVRERVATLYQIAPNHIFYADGNEVKEIQEINEARLILAKQFEEQQLLSNGYKRFFSLTRLCALWPAYKFVWKEFFMFSLSGFLLGIFLRRVWIKVS
ncbi:hypothetical protein GCK32_002235 [Trichostrongylus colubriformis]|uniref:Schlafen AlbA-2 domain-containing protein n=1 Tax=Trichostrongylus colubriformis TaxID=6319 RepID=A0AAN8IS26_TRICO